MSQAKHAISLSNIFQFFESQDKKCITRGENSYNSGHVVEVTFDKRLGIIIGQVYASMKDKKYKVEIFINGDGEIQNVRCTCPRGLFVCHHMAATTIHAHYNISSTDIACAWKKQKPRHDGARNISEVYPVKPYVPIDQNDITEESITKLVQNLSLHDRNLGINWLLLPEPNVEDNDMVPYIEDILLSSTFLLQDDQISYLKKVLRLTKQSITALALKTIGQSLNPVWLLSRKHRITASNFGLILNAHQRRKYPVSLFKKLAGTYDLDRVKSVQWGRQHEVDGLTAYEKLARVKIEATGLWLSEGGVLGASPDGFINDDGLIEIKCPYTHRNRILKDVLNTKDAVCFASDGSGEIIVNTNHNTYHQIQGQLHIVGREYCILGIWTTCDFVYVKIKKDLEWTTNLDILEHFYFEKYVPYILGN